MKRLKTVIKVNVKGRIRKGLKHEGWYIMVESTGSISDPYHILYSNRNFDPSLEGTGYDDWVEDFEAVEHYFNRFELLIEWLEDSEEKSV